MSKNAHFNPKSFKWVISLAVMIVLSAGVVFGSQALDTLANKKYNEPVEVSFTIASEKEIDISSTNAEDYGVKSVKQAYDEGNNLVAYIVEGAVTGYNQEVPIEMSSVISADGQIVCSIDILHQEETEYLGVRIEAPNFKDQFNGRYLPVVSSSGTEKGSPIDVISKSTISSEAVIDGVNNAQAFIIENFAAAQAE